jgi:hypothetical protein
MSGTNNRMHIFRPAGYPAKQRIPAPDTLMIAMLNLQRVNAARQHHVESPPRFERIAD